MSFLAAVVDPFSRAAEGARVPDEYAFPTETMTLKTKFMLNVPVSQKGINLTFRPSMTDTLVFADKGMIDGGLPNLGYFKRSKDPMQSGLYTTGWTDHYGTGVDIMFNDYRIVGAGIRFTSLMTPEKASGFFAFYTSPMERLNHFAMWEMLKDMYGWKYNTQYPLLGNVPVKGIDYQAAIASIADTDGTLGFGPKKAVTNVELLMQAIAVPWIMSEEAHGLVIDDKFTETPTGAMMNHVQFQQHGFKMAVRPITSDAWDWRKFRPARLFNTTVDQTNQAGGVVADTLPEVGVMFGDTSIALMRKGSNSVPLVTNYNSGGVAYSQTLYNVANGAAYFDDSVASPVLPAETIKQDGWTQVSIVGRGLPGRVGTYSPAEGWGATVGDVPNVAMVEVIMHVEYINQNLSVGSFARIAPKNPGMLAAALQAASVAPMYSYYYSEGGKATTKRMKVKSGY